MSERCTKRAPSHGTPDGFPLEKAAGHPRWKYELEPGARCEHKTGHEGAHRAGQLLWHDPPLLLVGGVPFATPAEREAEHTISATTHTEARSGSTEPGHRRHAHRGDGEAGRAARDGEGRAEA